MSAITYAVEWTAVAAHFLPIKENAMSSTDEKSDDNLADRVKKLEDEQGKAAPKDFWDRLGTVSPLIAGVFIALFGFYATNIYDKRARESEVIDRDRTVAAAELQTVEKFFPHLTSKDEDEKQAAILAISSINNPELATKIAMVFGGAGANAALTSIAVTASPADKAKVELALADLYQRYASPVWSISVASTIDGIESVSHGSCLMVQENGFALTAAHLFRKTAPHYAFESNSQKRILRSILQRPSSP
ncbi:hypothetical protein BZM26_09865 [Paraburkholderia strydomiana]|nr:hypothetical protein BZM26_09865 [Paraburkholderia strydomiana]